MKKDLVKVVMLKTIYVRGEMFKTGDEVEVNKREAKELISRGVARDISKDISVKPIEDETMKPIEDMTKVELITYATELDIEVSESMKKDDIIQAIINSENEE